MKYIRWVVASAAFVVLAASITPLIDGAWPWWLPAVQSLIRVWAIAAAVVTVIGLLTQTWFAVVAGVTALLFASIPPIASGAPSWAATCQPGESFRLMSFNTEHAGADAGDIATVVGDLDLDVVVLIETSEEHVQEFLASSLPDGSIVGDVFDRRTGPASESSSAAGTVIVSRLPMTEIVSDFDAPAFQQPLAEIRVGSAGVMLRGVHLHPPVKDMVDNWHAGLTAMGEWQQTVTADHVVLAGDFNAGIAHPAFRTARDEMVSAGGRLAPVTWPRESRLPVFTDIDHVLMRGAISRDFGVVDIDGSDHRGVWASIGLCRR